MLTIARVPVFHDELSLWTDWALRSAYITGDRPWPQRRPGEARVLLAALERDPDSAVLHNAVGALAFDQNRMDDAIREYSRARQLDPHDPAFALNLGRAYLLAGQNEAAVRTLEDAVRLESPSYFAQLNLGRAYMRLGDTARARVALERARAIRPEFTDWRLLLAQIDRLENPRSTAPPTTPPR